MIRARAFLPSLAGLLLALPLAAPSPARAGAWTQKEGEGQAILTLSRYQADSFWDADRNKQDQQRYTKWELTPYLEYGLTDWLTLGAQPSFQHVESKDNDGGTSRNSGLADTEIFLRERLWQQDGSVFSIQQWVKVPGGYDKRDMPGLGYGQVDAELRLLYGWGGTAFGLSVFIDGEAGFRKRWESPADEVRMDLTAGIRPIPRLLLMAQSFNTIGLRNADRGGPLVLPSAPDYDLHKIQLSAVVDLDERFSLQLGGYKDIAGRNTGSGSALLAALWIKF